jgi:hypothetical protein
MAIGIASFHQRSRTAAASTMGKRRREFQVNTYFSKAGASSSLALLRIGVAGNHLEERNFWHQRPVEEREGGDEERQAEHPAPGSPFRGLAPPLRGRHG